MCAHGCVGILLHVWEAVGGVEREYSSYCSSHDRPIGIRWNRILDPVRIRNRVFNTDGRERFPPSTTSIANPARGAETFVAGVGKMVRSLVLTTPPQDL